MTRSSALKYFFINLLIFVFSITGFTQPGKAGDDIETIMKQLNVVGLSVAVVKHSNIIYTHSFGLKDIESNIALSDKDIFRIASISKSFSATSIMQLVEDGKLSLSDDFSNLIGFKIRNPKYPEIVITLKMVMSHTSGLNDSQGYFNLDVINPAKNPKWTKCYNDYEPGTKFNYCNLNYNMVGTVIEKLSGERFDEYVKHHILDPLGLYAGYNVSALDSTLFATLYEYDSTSKKFKPAPLAYAPRREEIKGYVMGYSAPIFSPTGGMKISATDLAKYMTMHMNRGKYKGTRIISKKSSKKMQRIIAQKEGYGLAIETVTDFIPGRVLKGHTGSAYGLYSAMFFDPRKKFGFVVITNGCNPGYNSGLNNLTKTVIRSLYDNFIR